MGERKRGRRPFAAILLPLHGCPFNFLSRSRNCETPSTSSMVKTADFREGESVRRTSSSSRCATLLLVAARGHSWSRTNALRSVACACLLSSYVGATKQRRRIFLSFIFSALDAATKLGVSREAESLKRAPCDVPPVSSELMNPAERRRPRREDGHWRPSSVISSRRWPLLAAPTPRVCALGLTAKLRAFHLRR